MICTFVIGDEHGYASLSVAGRQDQRKRCVDHGVAVLAALVSQLGRARLPCLE